MSQSQMATRLRQEARALQWAAEQVREEAEILIERSTDLKRDARRFEEMADRIDDVEEVQRLSGDMTLSVLTASVLDACVAQTSSPW